MAIRTPISQNEFDELVKKVLPLKQGFDFLGDHVIITDEHGNILFGNDAVEKNTGFSREEYLGRNPGDLWGGQMPKAFYENMWNEIKVKKLPFVADVQNKRKDGTLYWQEVHISPLLDEHGAVKFFIAIEPNITEEKEKEQFRDEFISVMGHQLKSPLTTIKWIIELLLSDAQLTPEQLEYVRNINNANESAVNLVGSLLVLCRIYAKNPDHEQCYLTEELQKIISTVKVTNPKVKIALNKKWDGDKVEIPKIALQIFVNLIENAAQYSDKQQGEVSVTLSTESPREYFFSVRNNGLSIPKDLQGRITERFYRTPEAKEWKESGSGLGLFIVKLLCDKYGWKVWFTSPPEGMTDGAEFFVRFSSVQEAPNTPSDNPTQSP